LNKNIIYPIILAFIFLHLKVNAQQDSLSLDDFFLETENESISLLPEKMIFTQRILWGEKGLMRNFDYFELTSEKRQRELKVRRKFLGLHQILGFTTLAGMAGQGYVGQQLYNNGKYEDLHENLAVLVNATYFTTAGLSLFTPPKMLSEGKGYSNMKLHKALAVIHLSAMIATNVLVEAAEDNPDFRSYHRAAAFTAFGAYTLSIIAVKF